MGCIEDLAGKGTAKGLIDRISELYDLSSGSSIINETHDEKVLTFTGNLLTQVVYKKDSATVLTLTITYDSSDRPATVSNGTNTWTFTHAGTGFLSGVVKT